MKFKGYIQPIEIGDIYNLRVDDFNGHKEVVQVKITGFLQEDDATLITGSVIDTYGHIRYNLGDHLIFTVDELED